MLYFIAIVAPDSVNRQVLEWKHYMLERFNCKVALKSPAHITLVPPFSMHKEKEAEMVGILQTLTYPAFTIRLKNFDAFKPRVIFVDVEPNEPLQHLKKQLEVLFPSKKENRPFHPHVTIANRDLEKEDFSEAWAYFKDRRYDVLFEADTVSLLRFDNSKWEIAAMIPFLPGI